MDQVTRIEVYWCHDWRVWCAAKFDGEGNIIPENEYAHFQRHVIDYAQEAMKNTGAKEIQIYRKDGGLNYIIRNSDLPGVA